MNTDDADHDVLRELLGKESRRELPEFSPLLHARIMRNIRECERTDTSPRWRLTPAWYGLAAAAALAIGVSLWVFSTAPNKVVHPSPVAINPSNPTVTPTYPDPETGIQTAVVDAQSGLNQERYAGLDSDANNLVNYAINQIDPLGQ